MSAEAASERIKRAALARFVEVGFGSTTIDEIAVGAGVGVASIYRRWPDKAALANELMSDYLNVFAGLLEPVVGGTRKSRFMAFWRRLWEQSQKERELVLFVEAQAHAGFMSDEVAAHKAVLLERWVLSMPGFGVAADPAIATSMLVGTLIAVLREELDVDEEELGERLWAALRTA